MVDETALQGECELLFENYSRNDVHFDIDFYDEEKMLSLMNNDAPYEVKLKGKERKRIRIETNIDVSQMENQIDVGQTNLVNIIMKSGEKSRKL